MSKCPMLEYESHSYFGNANDYYVCTISDIKMDLQDPTITSVCKVRYDDIYKECPIYQSSIKNSRKISNLIHSLRNKKQS
jgi:hypothetical protein